MRRRPPYTHRTDTLFPTTALFRSLRADAVGTGDGVPVLHGDRLGEIVGTEHRKDGKRDPGADALHGGQEPEPLPLPCTAEAVQVDMVLADMRDDFETCRLSRRRQGGDRKSTRLNSSH